MGPVRRPSDQHETSRVQTTAQVFTIATYQRYSGLRRGREQEVAMVMCKAPGKFRYCSNFGSSKESPFLPIELRLGPQPGFTIRYWQRKEYRAGAKGTPIENGGYQELILIKLQAADSLAPGSYILSGRLIWRMGDQGPGGVWKGNGELLETDINLPVTV